MKRTRAANVTNCLIGTVVALLLSGSGSFVHAAVNTWTGTANDNWNMTGNWTTTNPGGVPVNGDSIVFSGTTPNNATDNDIGDLLVTGVTFDATAASYTLAGDRTPPGLANGSAANRHGHHLHRRHRQRIDQHADHQSAHYARSGKAHHFHRHRPAQSAWPNHAEQRLDGDLQQRRRWH